MWVLYCAYTWITRVNYIRKFCCSLDFCCMCFKNIGNLNNRFVIKRYYQMIEQEVTFLFSTNMLLLNKWNRIISGNHPLSICIKQNTFGIIDYVLYMLCVYIWKICKEHWHGLASIPKASNRCFVNILLNNCFPSFIPHKLGSQWMYVTRK